MVMFVNKTTVCKQGPPALATVLTCASRPVDPAPPVLLLHQSPADPRHRGGASRSQEPRCGRGGRGLCCVISPPRAPQATDPAVRVLIRTSSVFNFTRDDRWRMYRREITIYSAAIQLKNQLVINAFMCIGYFKVRSSVTNGC